MLDSRRVGAAALLLFPAGLTVYFAFSSGGFYAGPPAYGGVLLCAILLLRVMIAADPFEGFGWRLSVAVSAFSLLALLTLLSESWSHTPGTALVEFDRSLVYLLAIVVFGSIAHTRERMTWLLRAIA